jgi:predicted RNase H-like HicB family nuclease
MKKPKDTLRVTVIYSTEDDEYGPMYVATCDEIGLVTDGHTFEELQANLQEALAAALDETDTIAEFNLIPNPRILLTMELPFGYAKTA